MRLSTTFKYGLPVLLMLLSVAGYSQQPDTTCPQTSKLRAVYARAQEATIIQERLDTCLSALSILNGQISDLKEQIVTYKGQAETIALYEKKIEFLNQQRTILLKDITALQKYIRKRKVWATVKTIFITAASVAVTILIL